MKNHMICKKCGSIALPYWYYFFSFTSPLFTYVIVYMCVACDESEQLNIDIEQSNIEAFCDLLESYNVRDISA